MDNLYKIPFLSKELNMLGYTHLPYKKAECNNEAESGSEKGFSSSSHSEFHGVNVENVKISYNSREMIRCLVAVALQLVNDMKLSCQNDKNSDDYDKITFENRTLQKKLEAQERELKKNIRIINNRDETCRQLKAKVNELEVKIKDLEKEKLKSIKQHQSNEDIIKHQKKKMERDLFQLHTILYKERNLLDMKYLPQNFDIVQDKQPDLKKLWGQVKYSSSLKREEALKKAVCILQENNEFLFEDNSLLKTLLFYTIEEVNTIVDDICHRLKLSHRKIGEEEMQKIFMAGKGLQIQLYKDCMGKKFDILTSIFDCFDDCSFCVDDNTFIPLADVVIKMKSKLKES